MDTLFLIARIFLGLYFAVMGLNHFMKREMLTGYGRMRGLPAAGAGVVISGIALLAAGGGLLFNLYVAASLWVLIAFLVLAALSIHHFWTDQGEQRMSEMTNFTKNLALAAALLMVLALL